MKNKNENRPGYKKTKVGWIPNEWRDLPIHEVSKVVTGTTPNSTNEKYYGSDFLFIGPGDLDNIKYVKKSKKNLSQAGFDSIRKIPKGSSLFTCIGSTIGKMAIAGEVLSTNQQINAVIPNNKVEEEFLYYALLKLSPKIKSLASEQAVPIVNKTEFSAYKMPLPPIHEQKKIAEILSTWDRAIEKTEKLIEKCELRKKGLLQLTMNSDQLSVGNQSPVTSDQLSVKKEKWEEVQIGDVLKEVKRPLKMSDDESYQLVTVKRRFGGVEPRSILYGKEILVKNQYSLKEGDFLISKRQIVHGACNLVPKRLEGAIVSNEYLVFAPKKCIDIKYFNRLVQLPKMQHKFYLSSIGVHIEKMLFKYEWWKKEKILFPPIEEQKKIAKILDAADNEISKLKSKLEVLKEQKKGLMQKLLTGEVRVKNEELIMKVIRD